MTQTFKQWITEKSDFDIADLGGWMTQTFDQFANEIWEMAVEDAEKFGYENVADMISSFPHFNTVKTYDQFRYMMVWYACDKLNYESELKDKKSETPANSPHPNIGKQSK